MSIRVLRRCWLPPLVLVVACRGRRVDGLAPPPPGLAASAPTAPKVSAVASREVWQRAMQGNDDPIELDRLADAEGATGLLVGLEEGGLVGIAALSALPFADDAELALGRLAGILRQVEDDAIVPVMTAMEGIVERPVRQREKLDAVAMHVAFDALLEVAKRESLATTFRARAVSVARSIAARGPYDARLLPTTFDRL